MTAPKTRSHHDSRLNAVERSLLPAATAGTLVDLQAGDAQLDDPARGSAWDAARTVRASVLIDLLTGQQAPEHGRIRALKLRGARITGPFDLQAATLACPLLLADCHFEEPVILDEATVPAIRLPGCHLPALTADHLRTAGSLELNHGFTARGGVSLRGARIGGHLILSGASLANSGGTALHADLVTVDHSMLCRNGFTAHGVVRLRGAHIGGQLNLDSASLLNPGGLALRADRIDVSHIYCRDKFTAQGEVSLAYARVGALLDLTGASLLNRGGVAIDLQAASVAALYLLPRHRPDGAVILTNTKVDSFSDDPATWPETLQLRGFVYGTLENDHVSVQNRLRWLTLHPSKYTPQLYDQLAAAYRRIGHEEAARKVKIAKQWHRRAVLNPGGKFLNWLLYVTVGYGYRTWLAGAWLAGLLTLGTWTFSRAYPAHMTPANAHPAAFHPFAYTVDVLLPIVNLGQQNAWQPEGPALYWSWALTGAGWILTTAVVAGLTGLLKRD